MSLLVLASKSRVRADLMSAAGLSFEMVGSQVDEEGAKARLLARKASPREIAQALADEKAVAVSNASPGLVIGADQTLELDGALFDKVATIEAARHRLVCLRGCVHQLHAAVSAARDGAVLWRTVKTVSLAMRAVSDAFLDGYLARNGEALLSSVGCYQLEGEGVQLFERIDGDYFAILGLPMIELLEFLRGQGVVAS